MTAYKRKTNHKKSGLKCLKEILTYHRDNLKSLEVDKKYQKLIIKNADKKLIQSICECVLNILKGNLPIKESDKQKLKKFRKPLHKLVQKSGLKNKRKILIQQDGLLPILIPSIIGGLATIIHLPKLK